MDIRQMILMQNDCYKDGRYMTPAGITVHSTGANNPKLSRYLPGDDVIGYNASGNHWNKPGTGACVHAFIGKDLKGQVRVYQTLPWNKRAWHCAKGPKGSLNNTHISFEICEDALNDAAYFAAVYDAAVGLCAHLCTVYGFDPFKAIVDHSEAFKMGKASNHADVMHWFPMFGKSMDTLRKDVSDKLSRTEDEMAKIIEQIAKAAGMSTEQAIQTLGTVCKLANATEESWEKDGVKLLKDAGLITSDRLGNAPVSFGELGIILQRAQTKN